MSSLCESANNIIKTPFEWNVDMFWKMFLNFCTCTRYLKNIDICLAYCMYAKNLSGMGLCQSAAWLLGIQSLWSVSQEQTARVLQKQWFCQLQCEEDCAIHSSKMTRKVWSDWYNTGKTKIQSTKVIKKGTKWRIFITSVLDNPDLSIWKWFKCA